MGYAGIHDSHDTSPCFISAWAVRSPDVAYVREIDADFFVSFCFVYKTLCKALIDNHADRNAQ